ncbi:MAG: glycosyltransferase family 9 protein [Candidatus Hydrogenedens sp.]|nr:glycosyltransferase family 9 protein [Candidatus Hydrogenedens sp.]
MRAWAMRLIDYWVGRPLCLLLTCWRYVVRAMGLEPEPKAPPRKVLFIKLEEQGALVVASGAARRAWDLAGRENTYFCIFAENRAILDALDLVPHANVFTIRTSDPFVVLWDTLAALYKIRLAGIDAVIDLEFFARGSAVLTYLTGATRRVGLHGFNGETAYRGDLMTHRVAYNPYLHTAVAYDVLVRALEADPHQVPLLKEDTAGRDLPAEEFQPNPITYAETVERAGIGGGPAFVLHPNCTDTLRIRKWPSERYGELGRVLLAEYPDARIIFTGLSNEAADIEAIAQSIGSDRVLSLAGKMTLHEFLCLLSAADVLVTNDSGPSHFAAMTPVHQVVLYGPETPTLFGPLGDRAHVLYKHFACSPCLTTYNYRASPCQNNLCVQAITVDEVLAAVNDCIRERTPA